MDPDRVVAHDEAESIMTTFGPPTFKGNGVSATLSKWFTLLSCAFEDPIGRVWYPLHTQTRLRNSFEKYTVCLDKHLSMVTTVMTLGSFDV